MTLDVFQSQFRFAPERGGHIGVERECFITNGTGAIVPKAQDLLKVLHEPYPFNEWGKPIDHDKKFTYELSACQIEGRTSPCASIDVVDRELGELDEMLCMGMQFLKCKPLHTEVAPPDIPLTVYPDPSGRYQEIVAKMSETDLRAACRIIGTHVQIGMPDAATALKVYNTAIERTEELCALGDNSSGERLRIYRSLYPNCMPPKFATWQDFYGHAYKHKYVDDPRRCWTLIRISVHGTVEFRMFGTSPKRGQITGWAQTCHQLCLEAM